SWPRSMPAARAASGVSVTRLAPVSTRNRTGAPLTVAVSATCPRRSAGEMRVWVEKGLRTTGLSALPPGGAGFGAGGSLASGMAGADLLGAADARFQKIQL